jgi:hypothetical protein
VTRKKTLRHLRVELKGRAPPDEAATAAIAFGISRNATPLREIVLVDWQETSLTPVLTPLRDHPVLEKLQVEGFSSFTGIDALLRGEKSQLKELRNSMVLMRRWPSLRLTCWKWIAVPPF